jgi:hypothetical protein
MLKKREPRISAPLPSRDRQGAVPRRRIHIHALVLILTAAIVTATAASLPEANLADSIQAQGGDVVRDQAGRIIEVSLAGTWATDNDLARIVGIKTLKKLDLSFTFVSDRGVEMLQQLPQLEDLSLDTAEFITDAAASFLRADKQLKRLSLRGTDVTDISVQYLSVLTGLKALDISQTQIGDVGMDHLAAFAQLEELELGGDKISGASLNVLKLLPKLRKLSFNGIQRRNAGVCWAATVTDRDLDTVSLLGSLEELDLGAGIGMGTNKPDTNATTTGEAQCHVVGGIRITDVGLAKIAKLTHLQNLDLSGSEITPAGLKQLESLQRLQRLTLWNSKALDDSAAGALTVFPNLAVLDLSYTPVGDGALPGLARLPKLRQLYLTDTKVTPDGLHSFQQQHAQCFVSWAKRPAPIPIKPPDKDATKGMKEFQ